MWEDGAVVVVKAEKKELDELEVTNGERADIRGTVVGLSVGLLFCRDMKPAPVTAAVVLRGVPFSLYMAPES